MKRPLQAARHMQTSPALDSILHVLNPPLIKKLNPPHVRRLEVSAASEWIPCTLWTPSQSWICPDVFRATSTSPAAALPAACGRILPLQWRASHARSLRSGGKGPNVLVEKSAPFGHDCMCSAWPGHDGVCCQLPLLAPAPP